MKMIDRSNLFVYNVIILYQYTLSRTLQAFK